MPKQSSTAPEPTQSAPRHLIGTMPDQDAALTEASGSIGWMTGNWTPMASEEG